MPPHTPLPLSCTEAARVWITSSTSITGRSTRPAASSWASAEIRGRFNPATTGIVNYRDLSEGANPGIAGGLAQTFPDPDLNLSITNFAYHLNRLHDYFYRKGFTEAAGNFQVSNLSRGGAPLDPVQAEAQNGNRDFQQRHVLTPPDGTPGVARFGLFSIGTCRRDSGLDATVIYHEFTHGVSTRMVGGPQNVATLGSFQGGALGEGWSDAFPLSIFNDPVTGAYVTCNPRGIRSAPYNIHPATYADFGNKSGPFAAGIGSVFDPRRTGTVRFWAATVWDLHVALGPRVTQQLLFDGFDTLRSSHPWWTRRMHCSLPTRSITTAST